VVIGAGMLGLTDCAWAVTKGFNVIVCDVDDNRLVQARQFGASHTIKPSMLLEQVRACTDGRGADLVHDLSGSPSSAKLSLEVLRTGGTAVWVGTVFPTEPVPVLPEEIVRRCLTVTGIHNYTPADLASAVAFLRNHHKQFPFEELVSRTFPLDSVSEAFEFAERERPIRVAILCQ